MPNLDIFFKKIESLNFEYTSTYSCPQNLQNGLIAKLYRKNFDSIYDSTYSEIKNIIYEKFLILDHKFENKNYDFFKIKLLNLLRELIISYILIPDQNIEHYIDIIFGKIFSNEKSIYYNLDKYYKLHNNLDNNEICKNIIDYFDSLYEQINEECNFYSYKNSIYYAPFLD